MIIKCKSSKNHPKSYINSSKCRIKSNLKLNLICVMFSTTLSLQRALHFDNKASECSNGTKLSFIP